MWAGGFFKLIVDMMMHVNWLIESKIFRFLNCDNSNLIKFKLALLNTVQIQTCSFDTVGGLNFSVGKN